VLPHTVTGGVVTESSNKLVSELKAVRKGRGVHNPALDTAVGPTLRAAIGALPGAGVGEIRQQLIDWITRRLPTLPPDLQQITSVALNLHPKARQEFLRERIEFLAQATQRNDKTIRRRIDAGLTLLAESAESTEPAETDTWHLRRFSALLRMDGVTPECIERRDIVASTEISEIPWSISVPTSNGRRPPNLDIEVLSGVKLRGVEQPSPHRKLLHLGLPAPLPPGDHHEFSLLVKVPAGDEMQPTYVFWPDRRCERFDLVIRFDPTRLPDKIWRVNAAFHRDADDGVPTTDLLALDEVNEVSVSFTDLRPDRGYGIQWIP
jgi:hypothetical protein